MTIKMLGPVIAAMALVSFGVIADDRFSMSGTYEGGFACTQTNDGVPDGIFTPAELEIVQRGSSDINLALTFDIPGDGPQTLLFRGEVTPNSATPAVSGYFEKCGGSFEAIELVRILPAEADDESFNFTADSTFKSTEVPSLEGQLVVASCRYVFMRSDRRRPRIETCD